MVITLRLVLKNLKQCISERQRRVKGRAEKQKQVSKESGKHVGSY